MSFPVLFTSPSGHSVRTALPYGEDELAAVKRLEDSLASMKFLPYQDVDIVAKSGVMVDNIDMHKLWHQMVYLSLSLSRKRERDDDGVHRHQRRRSHGDDVRSTLSHDSQVADEGSRAGHRSVSVDVQKGGALDDGR
eukprot:gb/GFBE01015788.1/.p1 GENE.gb/GFBE01015788.1/~~gb/GFBE01015788.1/.p1  ORF type:complete len:137 (+),score=18.02 gb/GFBE01015788.1/:1-411(+)